jgi:NADPH:quinone reductase-like Zn-dependent oxidoreductase
MKAIVWTAYGPPEVLQLQEVAKPTPKANEVLIRIQTTTVTAGDMELRSFHFPYHTPWPMRLAVRLYCGLRRPTRLPILGQDLAGEIEAVGPGVTRYAVGDPVFAATGFGSGSSLGAYAEYKCLPETGVLAVKPARLSYGEAATLAVAGMEAVRLVRSAKLQPGHQMVIIGAGGSIGTFAVQLAKHYGAEVTAVDRPGKLERLRALGADHVVDYTHEDFTQRGASYDAILDVTSTSSRATMKSALKPNGTYIADQVSLSQILSSLRRVMTNRQQTLQAVATRRAENLTLLQKLIETGELKPIIDCTYPLEQMVEAHRYAESGQKMGHVVITVGQNSPPQG